MKVLAADVGGTKTLLNVAEIVDGLPRTLHQERLPSSDYERFEDLLAAFFEQTGAEPHDIAAACLAVAGPVSDGRARLTNLPWSLESGTLTAALGGATVELVNDFAAIAYALPHLGPQELRTLQGAAQGGPRLIVGAGTGLGVCTMSADGEVMPGEGGHAGFAPADEQQARLWTFVQSREGRCTREHLLSGHGIARIYAFLHQELDHDPDEALTALGGGDPAAHITQRADTGSDKVARETLRLFARIYGSQAGDLALGLLPRGGVYIAGGIAPRILPFLTDGGLLDAFLDKPPMRAPLENTPLHVILDPEVGLKGAVYRACQIGKA
ncbi:MAG: glucokinase [Gammaproteobacteria bacterium]